MSYCSLDMVKLKANKEIADVVNLILLHLKEDCKNLNIEDLKKRL